MRNCCPHDRLPDRCPVCLETRTSDLKILYSTPWGIHFWHRNPDAIQCASVTFMFYEEYIRNPPAFFKTLVKDAARYQRRCAKRLDERYAKFLSHTSATPTTDPTLDHVLRREDTEELTESLSDLPLKPDQIFDRLLARRGEKQLVASAKLWASILRLLAARPGLRARGYAECLHVPPPSASPSSVKRQEPESKRREAELVPDSNDSFDLSGGASLNGDDQASFRGTDLLAPSRKARKRRAR